MELTAQVPGIVGRRSLRVLEAPTRRLTAEELWDRHGEAAYELACALLGDEAAAANAVRLAMVDLAHSADAAPGMLARAVYRHASALPAGTPSADPLPRPMLWLSGMARLQRASLALCVYGGLTHREAAALLDVPPATVADLLTAGLRELGRLAATDAASCA